MAPSKRAGSARVRSARAAQAHDGVLRVQLADLQRARLIGAMFDVASQRGASSVSVARVVERSGVSRRTFYEHFSDREDCLLAAFERALTLASQRVVPAYDAAKGWREGIRSGLLAFLSFCDEQPSAARMLICESQASGPRVAKRRAEVLAALTRIVDQGRGEGKAQSVSPLAAEGTVGGALSVIQARLFEAEHRPLSSLTSELMSMIVMPYLGAAAARRELERTVPVPASAWRDGELLSDPFKDAGMRLTYRTVRVLVAITQHPGGSNRVIGETAGITDQGQTSKLLARLEGLGLIENTSGNDHQPTGEPNVWRLTQRGEEIERTLQLSLVDNPALRQRQAQGSRR